MLFKIFPAVKKLLISKTADDAAKKLITKSARLIFLVINMPTKKTKGDKYMFPTHQLAAWPKANEVIATETATGLKICFFFTVNIYFDAIAQIDAQIKKENPEK